jgi:uncharacterized protein (TIGR01777 family)
LASKILISGGSGLIGSYLSAKLKEKGFEVSILSSSKHQASGDTVYYWNIEQKEIDRQAVEEADYIIHLAGANIGDKRWTKKRKQLIRDSRIKSAQLLFEKVKNKQKPLKAFISASAVGYYGAITSETIYKESDPAAEDFLGETCRLWEQSADQFHELGVRVVKIRTGLVLSKQGGALSKMEIPIKMRIGSALGNGKQYMPWIHLEDLCNIYLKAIEDHDMQGAYNAVTPDNITNKEFIHALARHLKKPLWLPDIPGFILKFLLGEMSDLVLKGSRVSAEKITNKNFTFKFPGLESALNDLI